MAGECSQELGIDGAEEPFDPPPSLGSADGRVDNPNVEGESGLLEVVANEVGAVIDVQDVGDAAHCPRRVRFPPDRLPEGKGDVDS